MEILNLLIERVEHDGDAGNVAITFHAIGLRTISSNVKQHEETAA